MDLYTFHLHDDCLKLFLSFIYNITNGYLVCLFLRFCDFVYWSEVVSSSLNINLSLYLKLDVIKYTVSFLFWMAWFWNCRKTSILPYSKIIKNVNFTTNPILVQCLKFSQKTEILIINMLISFSSTWFCFILF